MTAVRRFTLSHLAAKAKVIWRAVQCSPFMGFFMRTPQCAFTMPIKFLFYWQTKQVSEGKSNTVKLQSQSGKLVTIGEQVN